jgi:cytochrome P450
MSNFIGFGRGIHACKGKMLALLEIRTVLIHLLNGFHLRVSSDLDLSRGVSFVSLGVGTLTDRSIMLSYTRRSEPLLQFRNDGK